MCRLHLQHCLFFLQISVARVLSVVGKRAEAVEVLQTALQECVKVLGPNHQVSRDITYELNGGLALHYYAYYNSHKARAATEQ